jgi:hypothetical protein
VEERELGNSGARASEEGGRVRWGRCGDLWGVRRPIYRAGGGAPRR